MTNKISPTLINNLKSQGYDLELMQHKKEIVGLKIKNPLEKLKIKGILEQGEYENSLLYQQEYEIAHLSNHSKPSYESLGTQGGKLRSFDMKDVQISSSKNIMEIQNIINRQEKAPQLNTLLKSVFQKQLSLSRVRKITKISNALAEKIVKQISILIDNYYKNTYKSLK
jgi:hypothetical protein